MKSLTRFAVAAAAVFCALLFAAPANAQATRTWISGVGDDANPCSRTAPCKTWAGAISKTAAGGEIDCLDPGGFGGVTITKAITLDCGGGIGGQVGSILVTGTNGINVNAGASDRVKIRNMSIDGVNGSGLAAIKFNTGASLTIEHVGIFGLGASSYAAVDFEPQAAGSELYMRDVEVQNNNSDGILVRPVSAVAAKALIENVASINNGGQGLNVADGGVVTVDHVQLSGNTAKGILSNCASVACAVYVENSIISSNGNQGVASLGANSTVTLSNTSIYGHATGLVHTGALISFQNNRLYGNTSNGTFTGTASLQ